jgi:fatty-acid desaturase
VGSESRAVNFGLESNQPRPWDWPWWYAPREHVPTLAWIALIHITAAIGLILFPWPGWRIVALMLAVGWLGGLGTTVCFHRAIAHRSVKLHPVVEGLLTFCAMSNGSGSPVSWVSNHRLHHAAADTDDDVSSPRHGFWWSHLCWLWQGPIPSIERYCPDLDNSYYHLWTYLLVPILLMAYFWGLLFSLQAFFWLGSIRMIIALHGQCFVNSICHMRPGAAPGEDSSRNVRWLGIMHLFVGENWHHNHHSRPGIARLGWNWHQLDAGYLLIRGLERIGLATEVRDFRRSRVPSKSSCGAKSRKP